MVVKCKMCIRDRNHTLQEFDMPTRTLPEVQSFVGNGLRLLLIRAIPQGEDNPQFEDCLLYTSLYPVCTHFTQDFRQPERTMHHIESSMLSEQSAALP